jgi:hypothetical protein
VVSPTPLSLATVKSQPLALRAYSTLKSSNHFREADLFQMMSSVQKEDQFKSYLNECDYFSLIRIISPNDYMGFQMRENLKDEMLRQMIQFKEGEEKMQESITHKMGNTQWMKEVSLILDKRLKELVNMNLLMSEFKDLIFDLYEQKYNEFKKQKDEKKLKKTLRKSALIKNVEQTEYLTKEFQ